MASSENDKGTSEFSPEDLARIFHYPSIGQLFSEPGSAAYDDLASRMTSTRDQLENVVRHGTREDADKAGIVVRGINVTLALLSSIQKMRHNET